MTHHRTTSKGAPTGGTAHSPHTARTTGRARATRATTPRTTLYTTAHSPLGELLVAGREAGDGFALVSLSVPGQRGGAVVGADWRRDDGPFTEALSQLRAYFAGETKEFRLPLAPEGTDFRQRVWRALDDVPFGGTTTYGRLAEAAGSPGAVRAVGGAVGANPLLVIRPCHRVIGSGGALTGYSGGLDRKRILLALEGVPLP